VEPVERPVVVDLGCGDGRLTAGLHEMLGARHTLGIDSSAAMIAAAPAQPAEGLEFALGDLAAWEEPASVDVAFANASLQWVPDHRAVLARWSESLRPGGQLAVQVPANADHPAHTVAAELAAELLAEPPQTRWPRTCSRLRTTRSCSTSSGSATSTSGSRSTSTTSARHERWSSG